MLDSDLAVLYGVETRVFNKAVVRNASRFPAEFAFVLTRKEFAYLMFQIGTSSSHGGRRKLPWVFTEHGTQRFKVPIWHLKKAQEEGSTD